MDGTLLHRIPTCATLPALPADLRIILEFAGSRGADLSEIARAISRDEFLSERLLRFADLRFFGRRGAVRDVRGALTLGIEKVRAVVVGLAFVRAFAPIEPRAFDGRRFWRRSVTAAAAASVLCARLGVAGEGAGFLASLLMDCGMLALDQVAPEPYANVVRSALGHAELSAAEAEALGVTHGDAGAVLAGLWRLPDDVVTLVRFHHNPSAATGPGMRPLADVAAFASRCADLFVDPQPLWPLAEARRMLKERFGLTETQAARLLTEVGRRAADLAPIFDLKPESALRYSQVLRKATAQLRETSEESAAGCGRRDQRAAPRIRRDADVVILPCRGTAAGASITVRLSDVSAAGIGILHAGPLNLGTRFVFRIRMPAGGWATYLYEVVRCRPAAPPETFHVGARFVRTFRDNRPDGPVPATPQANAQTPRR